MDVETSKKQTMMGKVSFVQWVMQSDVAVAQSDTNLAVWYNIDLTEHVTLLPVRGEVIDVIRDEVRLLFLTLLPFLCTILLIYSCCYCNLITILTKISPLPPLHSMILDSAKWKHNQELRSL